MKLDSSRQIFKNTEISNSIKFRPVKTEFHAGQTEGRIDRQTNRHDEYCFLALGFLHGVRGKFPDDVSETAVVSHLHW